MLRQVSDEGENVEYDSGIYIIDDPNFLKEIHLFRIMNIKNFKLWTLIKSTYSAWIVIFTSLMWLFTKDKIG